MNDEELRELDAEIHRKVFGHKSVCLHTSVTQPDKNSSLMICGSCGRSFGATTLAQSRSRVPRYSTDITAAWSVVEKLGELGYTIDLEWKGKGRGYEFTAEVSVRRQFATEGHGVGTAPEAICRAALMATEGS